MIGRARLRTTVKGVRRTANRTQRTAKGMQPSTKGTQPSAKRMQRSAEGTRRSAKGTRQRRRSRAGASLVETMVGFIIIIPIGLAAIDIVILLSTSQSNEQWAEMAAKAASRRGNEQAALKAAQNAIDQCPRDNVVLNIQVADVNFDIGHGKVTVDTVMDVKLPIPVPFMPPDVQFRANSTQPIVSTRAPI